MSAIKRFPGGSSPASVSQHRHPRFDPNLTKLQTYDTDTSEILITVGYARHKIEWDIHIACGSCLQYLFLSNRFKSLLFALCVYFYHLYQPQTVAHGFICLCIISPWSLYIICNLSFFSVCESLVIN